MSRVPSAVGDGWLPLCEELQRNLGRLDPPGELLGVGTDASGLPRFEVKLDPRAKSRGSEIVRDFEGRAMEVCEVCGRPGHVRGGPVVRTRCDHCV
jgi:hypothetical protein